MSAENRRANELCGTEMRAVVLVVTVGIDVRNLTWQRVCNWYLVVKGRRTAKSLEAGGERMRPRDLEGQGKGGCRHAD